MVSCYVAGDHVCIFLFSAYEELAVMGAFIAWQKPFLFADSFGLLCGEPYESAEYDEDILFKSNRKVQTENGVG